jgi:hypothetical protein
MHGKIRDDDVVVLDAAQQRIARAVVMTLA